MKLDVLAFGVHPDDVELGCSGTLMNEIAAGKKVAVIDLTQGELGTRGSIETRYAEAAAAAAIMGLHVRENLKMADGFFKNEEDTQRLVISAIRKYRPDVVICNAPEDRHPDHGRASQLVSDAGFLSGLRKIITTDENGKPQEPWRPSYVLQYIQDRYLKPDFVVDISSVIDRKIEAIKAYTTQFYNPDLDEPSTYISSPEFFEHVINRSKMLGIMIGVKHAEGFITNKIVGLPSLDGLIKNPT
jgi:bacillithiol biosynthesis deacetylase BshB1